MKVTRNIVTITDLNDWLEEGTLIINNKYQRKGELWPKNSRSYFLDTILNEFTFPKVTIRQTIDLKTKKSVREVVDGQQRLMTIKDFIKGDITLSSVSKKFKGCNFAALSEDVQESFLAYEVSVDTIVSGTQDEILEIFRRMNSYTLPLNVAEKRHATYQGEFKWFILDMVERYSPLFEKYEILSVREIARMLDADLITELSQILLEGVITRSSSRLERLYKYNDEEFAKKEEIENKIKEVMDFVKIDLDKICTSGMLASYLFYSLFSALVYNKYGITDLSSETLDNLEPTGVFTEDKNTAIQNILELFKAVDQKRETGKFSEFVKASSSTTHSVSNRLIRLKWLVRALQNNHVFN